MKGIANILAMTAAFAAHPRAGQNRIAGRTIDAPELDRLREADRKSREYAAAVARFASDSRQQRRRREFAAAFADASKLDLLRARRRKIARNRVRLEAKARKASA